MRWGLEQSRNLMTVRTANMTGMDRITKLARTLGVGDYPNYLSIALGAGETTVLQMTNAFAILANRSEEHTSELQSLMRISYAVFCLKKKNEINSKPLLAH